MQVESVAECQCVPDSRPQRLRARGAGSTSELAACGVRTVYALALVLWNPSSWTRHLIGIVLRTHNANGPSRVPSTVQRPP